ncbi:MAG: UDP-N-acetylmuramate:L-alanyl-gamma-D-glutamyl-meso-diaminopimelate ligase [Opitutaceae bacterium]|nr:UDP-N-acetylmuramate:L-alanyl-gamma-D-glutamyl-meso-diaminopimelate ligase [Opitutaceae bacterium]
MTFSWLLSLQRRLAPDGANRQQKRVRIYFMGVCGTAMGNVALLAREAGHDVSGADTGVYPPMSTVLANSGIQVFEGYDPARLETLQPDLVVIGNAMSRGNPEVEWLLDTRQVRFTSLPSFLYEAVLERRQNIVVCGTHGKTTTTALAAFLLRESGKDPGFLIGGVPLDPPTGSHLGKHADPFVIEGDEYDSAFFDKRSKFIHYAPTIAVLNNLEFDHADIFRDLADVQRTFIHLSRIVPRRGWIVRNGDDANLDCIGATPWTRTLRVGTGEGNDIRIIGFSEDRNGSSFTLLAGDKTWGQVRWSLTGLFNVRNAAMAATAAALSLQPAEFNPSALSLEPLARFRAVKRRQEVLFESEAVTVIEDFGHHPTAIAETLKSLRNRYPGRTIHAAFEPRSNTARTKTLQSGFLEALAHADSIHLGAVNRATKLSAEERFDAEGVAASLRVRGKVAASYGTNEDLRQALASGWTHNHPNLVVFFTNGSFDGIIPMFVQGLKS